MVTINENSITVRFASRKKQMIPNARPRPLPRRNGKLDFIEIQKCARAHARAREERARHSLAVTRKIALRRRYQLRRAAADRLLEHRPLIGTYAEAVELGLPLPSVPLPRLRKADFYRSCTCRLCLLAEQANKAKENGLKKVAERRSAKKEIARINRRFKRRYCAARAPTSQEQLLANLLAGFEPEVVECEEVAPRKACATSRKQVKTSWKSKPQSFRWEDFYVGEVQRSEAPFERKRTKIVRKERMEESVAETGVRAFLTQEARLRRVALGKDTPISVQMEAEDAPVDVDQQGNVVIQEATAPVVEVIGPQLTNLRKYCQGDTVDIPTDTDRWITLNNITWATTQTQGTMIYTPALPWRAIWEKVTDPTTQKTTEVMKANVMANLARVRQFIQTDMEVRVMLNSSPFMVGQLQVGWLYAYSEDAYGDLRMNPAGISQMDHVIVDAAESGSGSLVIPYRSYRPYLPINKRNDMGYNLDLGALIVAVLNPLVIPAGGPTSIDGVVMIRFSNCTFTGMVPPGLTNVETQMFSAMSAAAAAQWLYQRYADPNRDAPPAPQAPPQVVPVAMGNLAVGVNVVEPVLAMRLDAKGQTPHPEGVPDDMLISSVTGKFGFVETIEIPATSMSGTSVFCYDAAPVLDKKHYVKQTRDGVDCYTLPPVAVVSQLFAYWRGSVEYRFDFIATRFHQMRLYFAWVPGYLGATITLAQAQSCAGTYYDLKEGNRSVTVTVPYISDRPWWSHRYANGVDAEQYEAPGKFCCFIVNKLTYTYVVPNKIWCNVYMRGGENFELAVPMQPTIGLAYNARFKNASDVSIQAVPGYYPWGAGTWRNVKGGTRYVMRYGDVTDHVAQFYGVQPLTYYKFKDVELAKTAKLVTTASSGENIYTGDNWILVPVDVGDGYGMAYLGLYDVNNLANIFNFFYTRNERSRKWMPRSPAVYDYDMLYGGTLVSSDYYSGSGGNAELVPTQVPPPANDVDDLEVQGDNRTEAQNQIKFEIVSGAGASLETFGESFHSLKDLCRRYQPYTATTISSDTSILGGVNVSFPLLPGGLNLHPLHSARTNSCREGIIPIVMSGYRFFRGGLRFKIVTNMADCTYVCQVKPDRALLNCDLRQGGTTVADSMIQQGYAMAVQSYQVNPVMVVEVPFYIPGSAGLLCRPSADAMAMSGINRFFSLGEMCLSFSEIPSATKKAVGSQVVVMYALADDFSAHTFQGFPPIVFVKEAKTDL